MLARAALIAICLLLFFSSEPLRAETITLTPVADTCLFELNPDYNFGFQNDLPSGRLGALASYLRSRVLLRFDLAAHLPANAQISFAYLQLHVTRAPDGGGENSTFGLHRMLRDWAEGNKRGGQPGGARAEAGEATWNAAFHPDQLWAQPGGQAGVDYLEEPTSTERIQQDGIYQFEFGSAQIGELTGWLQNPESNFGWILISTAEDIGLTARRFGARENTPDYQPQLVIEYNLPTVPAPTITGISLQPDGTASVTFQVEAGLSYRLESTESIPASSWQTAAPSTLAEETGEMTLNDPSQSVARFYRVAVE